ncbi:MAG TPA: SirB2 family protein [Rubrivivax sp.]|nr:SirB2 family protein [Rubrivivax sp.]
MAIDPATLKWVHQAAVLLSVTGFFVRGVGTFTEATWSRGRIARTLPHAVDTVLLLSALALAWGLRLTPGNAPWLVAKIAGLLLYIGLGMLALRPGRTLAVRVAAWVAALLTFGWIVSVAMTRDPLGALRWLLPLLPMAASGP